MPSTNMMLNTIKSKKTTIYLKIYPKYIFNNSKHINDTVFYNLYVQRLNLISIEALTFMRVSKVLVNTGHITA